MLSELGEDLAPLLDRDVHVLHRAPQHAGEHGRHLRQRQRCIGPTSGTGPVRSRIGQDADGHPREVFSRNGSMPPLSVRQIDLALGPNGLGGKKIRFSSSA